MKFSACAGITMDWPVIRRYDLPLMTISTCPSMICTKGIKGGGLFCQSFTAVYRQDTYIAG